MLRVALKGVWSRKLRLLLTSIAVVLGVGFVAGAFFLTDSLRASFDTIFTEAAQGLDVQVATKEYNDLEAKQQTSGVAAVPIDLAKVGVKPETLETIRQVPGVQHAEGSIFEIGAQPLDKKGGPIGNSGGGAPTFAANWARGKYGNGPLHITKGEAPRRDEVMLDANLMKDGKYEIGDKLDVSIQGGRLRQEFRISGVVRYGKNSSLNGASITVFETKQLQELLEMDDRFSTVSVAADPGVSQTTLKHRVQQALDPSFDVITGKEYTKKQTESINDSFLNILQNVILGFAAIAVFVGAFTIFNTFTILVGQRTREFGLLRAIGSSRMQIITIVVLEAVVLGIIASTIGILAGYGIAALLRSIINGATGGGFPGGSFPLHTRTIVWSYSVGVIVTLVACVVPAVRASRLSPLEALRSNPAHAGRGWKAQVAGALLAVIGTALIIWGLNAGEGATVKSVLVRIGGGFAIAIIGISLLSRSFILPVTKALGSVLARGTTGELASRNVLRNRARSATTAAALMIGLALATLVLIFYSSINKTIGKQIDDTIGADITVINKSLMGSGYGFVDQKAIDTINDTEGVETSASQRFGGVALGTTFTTNGNLKSISAFDDEAIATGGLVELEARDGVMKPGDGVIVDSDFAKSKHLKVGSKLQLAFPTGDSGKYRVNGIFKPAEFAGAPILTSVKTFTAVQPPATSAPAVVYIRVADDADTKQVVKRIKHELGEGAASLEVQDSDALRTSFTDQFKPILALILGMLSLSLVIALFGIGNTLALNVFERTRELGLIRAVGGTRRQVRRMIRVESVLVAVFGAVIGVIVGALAGYALISALKDDGFVFSANVIGLIAVLIAGLVAGLLASILPARRAARTDVLAAIATE
jgi:putative ABC transport system permease protein